MTNESLNVSDSLSAGCGSVEQSTEGQFLAKLGADGRPCRLGVMGGTFDPIHNGHLEIARRACESLGLSGVLFVVAGDPWMKHGRALTPAEDRFAMVQAAIEGDVRFAASRREIDRVGETVARSIRCASCVGFFPHTSSCASLWEPTLRLV